MEKINIGFIGCGGIGKAHMFRLSKIEDVNFVAMCDIEISVAKECAKLYGGKVYTDFREMFDKERIDACYICVPPFSHIGQEEECIERNIPFFVEKPIHLDLKKAEEILKRIKLKNLITSVGYVLRYYDVVENLKELIKKEKIGIVRGKYYGEVPGGGKKWFIRKELSGGQLIEQATHIVDLMRYLCGEISEVFAYKFEGINSKLYENYNVEDGITMILKFENNIIGNLTCTWLWKGYDSEIEIVGKDIIFTFKGGILEINREIKIEKFLSSLDPMFEEDYAFIKSVREKNPSYIKSDYEDALKTLKVTIKAHESIKENLPIRIL